MEDKEVLLMVKKRDRLEHLLIEKMLKWVESQKCVDTMSISEKEMLARFAQAVSKLKPQSANVTNIYNIQPEEILNEFRRLNSVARAQSERRKIQTAK